MFAEAAEALRAPLVEALSGSRGSATTASSGSSTSWPSLLGYALLAALLLEILVILLEPFQRWRLRHIPGPPALPLVGCVPQILRMGSPIFFQQCYQKYGPVFKVALGRRWAVVIADAELMRQVGFKLRNHVIVEASLMRGVFRKMDQAGLFLAKDDQWKFIRSAWQPAFSAGSLSGYLPRMLGCADDLARRLEARAVEAEAEGGSGKAGGRVDMWRELGSMTLQVVGSTAYGVDFLTMEDSTAGEARQHRDSGKPPAPAVKKNAVAVAATTPAATAAAAGAPGGDSIGDITAAASQCGRELMRACADVFRYGSAYHGGRYMRAAILLPELRPLLSWMAHAAPDWPFKRILTARTKLRNTCLSLIADWEAKQRQEPAMVSESAEDASVQLHNGGGGGGMIRDAAAAAEPSPPPSLAAAAKAPGSRGATAVEPGSFLGLILAARDKTTGQALDNDEVAAQVQTFILAGYETTANALTFAVYSVAKNPEVERRLLAEIDEVLGPDRLPTEADLPRLPYTEAVFNEALRLYPPAHSTIREVASSPIDVGGYKMPPGTSLILAVYASHRDPRVWPRVEEFIPERFMPTSPLYPEVCSRVPNAHAPFGYGVRMCIGWKFAVQEAKIALARLYQRLRFELEPGLSPMVAAAALTLAPKDGLWVRPVLRHPLPPASPAQQ
ncbi:hypothetical protein PLESTF_000527500 [Pleodorina starrii]|nr:hypothetical protein PLESTF_000527500 [Pleodorina starrii]